MSTSISSSPSLYLQHRSEYDDPVRPSDHEVLQTIKRSRNTWFRHVATVVSQEAFSDSCFDFLRMFTGAPALVDDSIPSQRKPLKKEIVDDEIQAYGYSTWVVTGPTECGLGGELKKTDRCSITLGVRKPTLVNISDTSFQSSVIDTHPRSVTSIVLFLGLAYVFSQRLIELQGEETGHTKYTSKLAPIHKNECCHDLTTISVGSVDYDTKRWWQAILAPGRGWESIIAEDAGGNFFSPWAIQIKESRVFQINCNVSSVVSYDTSPPSSSRALHHLRDFCRLHHAETEFQVAVAMASLLPVHNYYYLPVDFTFPLLHRVCESKAKTAFSDKLIDNFDENISKCITFSCNPRGILSTFCGVFWEPDVPCNLVSAWLYPPLDQLPCLHETNGAQHRYYEVLVRECAIRRPNIASIFLGASLTNLLSVVIRLSKTGLPPLDLDAAAWARSEQSFIQHSELPLLKLPAGMPRSNVWRLLYITGDFSSPPLTPWKPFGIMATKDIALSARTHHECIEHLLHYHHWSWELIDNSDFEDVSDHRDTNTELDFQATQLRIEHTDELQIPPSETASEAATKHAFQWVTINGDGYPSSERKIYSHEWIIVSEDSDEKYDTSDAELSDVDSKYLCPSDYTKGWVMH